MTGKPSSKIRGKSEEKRHNILHAAGKLFLDQGFEGVSMDQVAAGAGVSKQTVYSHFGAKEDLFSAVIACKCEEHQLTAQLFDPQRPVADVLLSLAEHFSELLLSDESIRLHRICVAGAEQRSSISALFWAAGPEVLYQHLHDYLSSQAQRGRLHIPNTAFAAQQFLFMIKGEAQMRRMLGLEPSDDVAELPNYLRSCVDVFISAYGK